MMAKSKMLSVTDSGGGWSIGRLELVKERIRGTGGTITRMCRRPPGGRAHRGEVLGTPRARLNVVEPRNRLADVLNRAENRGDRIVIHRRDKDAAAIIPVEDLRPLERLVREKEDRIDAAADLAA